MTETIPLFPLGVVLFPEMLLPLYVFEERHTKMIKECIENNKEFGVIYYNGEMVNNTGCSANVIKILKEYEDGRMDVIAEGFRRFKIKKIHEDKPYLEASIKYFDDKSDNKISHDIIEEAKTLLRSVISFVTETNDLELLDDLDPKSLSFLVAMIGGFTLEEKQVLLELENTKDRLNKEVKVLKEIIKRIKITYEVEKIIRGNGNLQNYSFE